MMDCNASKDEFVVGQVLRDHQVPRDWALVTAISPNSVWLLKSQHPEEGSSPCTVDYVRRYFEVIYDPRPREKELGPTTENPAPVNAPIGQLSKLASPEKPVCDCCGGLGLAPGGDVCTECVPAPEVRWTFSRETQRLAERIQADRDAAAPWVLDELQMILASPAPEAILLERVEHLQKRVRPGSEAAPWVVDELRSITGKPAPPAEPEKDSWQKCVESELYAIRAQIEMASNDDAANAYRADARRLAAILEYQGVPAPEMTTQPEPAAPVQAGHEMVAAVRSHLTQEENAKVSDELILLRLAEHGPRVCAADLKASLDAADSYAEDLKAELGLQVPENTHVIHFHDMTESVKRQLPGMTWQECLSLASFQPGSFTTRQMKGDQLEPLAEWQDRAITIALAYRQNEGLRSLTDHLNARVADDENVAAAYRDILTERSAERTGVPTHIDK